MKNITKESVEKDHSIVYEMFNKYIDAIYENQEGQLAHYDNQHKLVKLVMADVRTGLKIATDALSILKSIDFLED